MTMRLCIPTASGEGLAATLSEHFGRAPVFTLIDTESAEVQTFPNPERRHDHGRCAVAAHLADRNVDGVVCREIGRNSLEALTALGIVVYETEARTVGDVRNEAVGPGLRPLSTPTRAS